MARTSPITQLEKIRAARIKLEKEEQRLMSRSHDKALAQIVQIAHSAGLSAADISAAIGSKTKGKKAAVKAVGAKAPKAKRPTAGKKVAPKYRDPSNSANTWTGRGRMPQWVQALHAAGSLASAEIKTAE
ncbi:MAG: H-NS histone family protein [Betaproteobacteria bacterium]|nr:H-NS histone family protein [Betaproteobacteria bacterium]